MDWRINVNASLVFIEISLLDIYYFRLLEIFWAISHPWEKSIGNRGLINHIFLVKRIQKNKSETIGDFVIYSINSRPHVPIFFGNNCPIKNQYRVMVVSYNVITNLLHRYIFTKSSYHSHSVTCTYIAICIATSY